VRGRKFRGKDGNRQTEWFKEKNRGKGEGDSGGEIKVRRGKNRLREVERENGREIETPNGNSCHFSSSY